MFFFKNEVLLNVYEMRLYLIIYVVVWFMIGYFFYFGKFFDLGVDILICFCLII